jgi:hypothetical protein
MELLILAVEAVEVLIMHQLEQEINKQVLVVLVSSSSLTHHNKYK